MPALQPTELSLPTASMLVSNSNSTFGLFDSFSTTSTSEPPPRALPTRPEGYHSTRWSFEPMPSDLVSSGIASPIAESIAAGLVTPVRPTPHQIPSTIPKSAARRRPLSERDDMVEMVQCVTASARKRSAPRFIGPVSSGSSFRREEMEVWHQSMSENLSVSRAPGEASMLTRLSATRPPTGPFARLGKCRGSITQGRPHRPLCAFVTCPMYSLENILFASRVRPRSQISGYTYSYYHDLRCIQMLIQSSLVRVVCLVPRHRIGPDDLSVAHGLNSALRCKETHRNANHWVYPEMRMSYTAPAS